jgi:hypothetical protein
MNNKMLFNADMGAGGGGAEVPSTPVTPISNAGTVLTQGANNTPTDWKTSLPEDLRSNASLQNINDIPSLAKSYVHAQSLVGADKIVIPKEGATPEEWSNFWKKVGRPDEATAYNLNKPENFPDQAFDQKMLEHMQGIFHETGLTSRQAETLYNKYMDYIAGEYNTSQQEFTKQAEESLQKLKVDFGSEYNVKLAAAQRTLQQFGSPELVSYLDQTGLGNSPELIKLFANIGLSMSESTARDGESRVSGQVTSQQAMAEIDNLRQDGDFIKLISNKSGLGHREAVKRWQNLHALAYPDDV